MTSPTQPYPCYVGNQEVWFYHPERFNVILDDLRTPLSRQCRYGGNFDVTVLQHLALCVALAEEARATPRQKGLLALHDLHEAVLIDLPASLKALLPDYAPLEASWEEHFHKSLGYWPVTLEEAAYTKDIDNLAAAIEMYVVGHPNVAMQVAMCLRAPSPEEHRLGRIWLHASNTTEQWCRVKDAVVSGVLP